MSFRSSGEEPGSSILVGSIGGAGTEMILLVIEDIASRKRADVEIRKLNEKVSKKALALELVNKELDSFTSAVSHDLKNELIVISAFTGRLIKRHMERLDAKGKEYMRIINSSVENLTALVGDLLEMSRLSKTEMRAGALNLSELASSILKKYQEKDPERQVEAMIPIKVEAWGDRRLLTVVFDNLLSNARKYTITLAVARIEFGVVQDSEEFIFSSGIMVRSIRSRFFSLSRGFTRLRSTPDSV